jgi:cobalt-zinc-cadmium efflux system membrane fusion protein
MIMKNYIISALTVVMLASSSELYASDNHAHDHRHIADGGHEEHSPHVEDDEHEEHSSHDKNSDHEEHASHDEHGDHEKRGDGEDNNTHIDGGMAQEVGIVTSITGSQELHQTITVYGSLVSAPEQLSHVRARFEGLVKSVRVNIGDRVKTGDVLAEIESNESLKGYQIRSPISGRIVQRHANTGEVTQDQVLFSIANLEAVWAELRIFPAQQSLVTEGQTVHVLTQGGHVESKIQHIVPSMEFSYQLARVQLDNRQQSLFPGLMVEALLETGRFPVPLAVAKDAVQNLGGRQGVFVKDEDNYTFTPLLLGRADDQFYEVIDGIEVNTVYVSQNSYLIKADIEKSEAEHEH